MTPEPTASPEATPNTTPPVAQGTPQPACDKQAPQGFEEFDLDDIEVIESKVFA